MATRVLLANDQPTTNLGPSKQELFVPYVYGKSRAEARDRVYQAYAEARAAGEIPEDD